MKRAILWLNDQDPFLLVMRALTVALVFTMIGVFVAMARFGVHATLPPAQVFTSAFYGTLGIGALIAVGYGFTVCAWRPLVAWASAPVRPISTCTYCRTEWSPLDHLTCPRCKEKSQRTAREAAAIDPFLVAAKREVEAIAPEEP